MNSPPVKDPLKPFKQHGVVFRGSNQSQAYGDCPFTGKQDKFYVNRSNLMWDSKTAGLSGNLTKFLEYVNEQNQEDLTEVQFEKLSHNRGIPKAYLKKFEIGKSASGYTFPIKDEKGKIADLRMYRLNKKVVGTAGRNTCIFNLHKMMRTPKEYPVYLCEGEWDGMAMSYLLEKNKVKAVAVAVPGANTFKREWAKYFKERDVIVCYDNDESGEAGELIVKDRLHALANSLHYMHWTPKFYLGYDIRDLVVQRAIEKKIPKATYRFIKKSLRNSPRKQFNNAEEDNQSQVEVDENIDLNVTIGDVRDTIGKWLKLNNYDGLYVALATAISTFIEGDPLWTFIVGAPGGAKTELLQTLDRSRYTFFTSSLTPHSLISGASTTDGHDPSLLPKLDMMCLIIKDFTTILGLREPDKDMIFSILRDAYDGKCSKTFGRGFTREYKVHFSMLAGVTPEVYSVIARYAGLGDRFLKFNISGSLSHDMEFDVIDKSMSNMSKETEMRDEMQMVVNSFVTKMVMKMQSRRFKMPEIPRDLKVKLINAVQAASCLRGTVSRHWRDNDVIMTKPFREVGTRLGKQLLKMMTCLAIIFDHEVIGEEEYRIARKILLDTVDQRIEEMVKTIYLRTPTKDDSVTSSELQIVTGYNRMTIRRLMDDLTVLKTVLRQGKANKYEYTITTKIKKFLDNSDLYSTVEERIRPRADFKEPKKKVVVKRKKRSRTVRRKRRNR